MVEKNDSRQNEKGINPTRRQTLIGIGALALGVPDAVAAKSTSESSSDVGTISGSDVAMTATKGVTSKKPELDDNAEIFNMSFSVPVGVKQNPNEEWVDKPQQYGDIYGVGDFEDDILDEPDSLDDITGKALCEIWTKNYPLENKTSLIGGDFFVEIPFSLLIDIPENATINTKVNVEYPNGQGGIAQPQDYHEIARSWPLTSSGTRYLENSTLHLVLDADNHSSGIQNHSYSPVRIILEAWGEWVNENIPDERLEDGKWKQDAIYVFPLPNVFSGILDDLADVLDKTQTILEALSYMPGGGGAAISAVNRAKFLGQTITSGVLNLQDKDPMVDTLDVAIGGIAAFEETAEDMANVTSNKLDYSRAIPLGPNFSFHRPVTVDKIRSNGQFVELDFSYSNAIYYPIMHTIKYRKKGKNSFKKHKGIIFNPENITTLTDVLPGLDLNEKYEFRINLKAVEQIEYNGEWVRLEENPVPNHGDWSDNSISLTSEQKQTLKGANGTDDDIPWSSLGGIDIYDEPDDLSASAREFTPTLEPISGGNPPLDIDEDGLFEDINGDGTGANSYDVQILFDNLNSDSVTNYPSYYNFAGGNPSDVGVFDVQALSGMNPTN